MTNPLKGYIRLFIVAATCWLAYSGYGFITESRTQQGRLLLEQGEDAKVLYSVPVYTRDAQGMLTPVVSMSMGLYGEVKVLRDVADCFPRKIASVDQLALYETAGPLLEREERLVVLRPELSDLVTAQGRIWHPGNFAPELECARKADQAFEARHVEARRQAGARTLKSSLLQALGGVLAIGLLLWVAHWLISGFSTERR